MTSRYRGENAVPLSLKGVGIAPTVELSVVIGMGVPLLSFPRFHGFRQTNRTSWFAICFPSVLFPCFGVCTIDNYRCTCRSLTLFFEAKFRKVNGYSIVGNSLSQTLILLALLVCQLFAHV